MKPFMPQWVAMQDTTLKNLFGEGPWQAEPDCKGFTVCGYAAQVIRHPSLGMLNGYLRLPVGHPWHGLDCEDLAQVEVHWGLTFAAKEPQGDGWLLGFDAAHADDLIPATHLVDKIAKKAEQKPGSTPAGEGGVPPAGQYRDFDYMEKQLHRLAAQAKAAERQAR